MKVPPSVEDNFIPMEALDFTTLQEQRRRRNDHWARLKRARVDCNDTHNYPKWLEDTWGIKVHMNAGMITDDYTVVDEKKYTLYLLKYVTG